MSKRKDYKQYWQKRPHKAIPSSLQIDLSQRGINHYAKILDIGCGNAELLRSLKNEGFTNLFGVDLNISLPSNEQGGNIKIYTQDATKLLFPENFFDVTIMKALLTVVVSDYSIYKALKEAFRVLNHGGILFIKDFFQNWHLELYRSRYLSNISNIRQHKCIFPVYNEVGEIRYYARHFNTQELSQMLINIGFTIKELKFEQVKTQSGNTVIGFTIIAVK